MLANPFDPTTLHTKDVYNAPNLDATQEQIQQHLQSPQYDAICKIIANEAKVFKTPAAQIMTDIFHQSMQDWPTFMENTTISDLRIKHIDVFKPLQLYQSQFTSSIYAPLHEYLSSTNTKFAGSANDLLLRISQIINQVKNRRVLENCGAQFEVRYIANITNNSTNQPQVNLSDNQQEIHGEDTDPESDDEEAKDVRYRYSSSNFEKSNKPTSYRNDFGAIASRSIVSQILKYSNEEDANHGMVKIIRPMLTELVEAQYTAPTYLRYEILMDDTNVIKTFPAFQNNTIPAIDIENIPFLRIYNSTNSVQSILDYLSVTGHKDVNHMMTFSIHFYHGHIEIYFYIYSNGKLYGSRMFEQDLMTIIPKLFEDEKVEDTGEISHNFKISNRVLNVEFNHPKKYEEYKLVLYKQDRRELEYEIDYRLKGQLERFISSWNSKNNRLQQIDMNKVMHIFPKYKIDYKYFEDGNNRQQFIRILQERNIATNVANELWMEFGGEFPEETDTVSDCLSATSSQRMMLGLRLLSQHELIKAKQKIAKQDRMIQKLLNQFQQQKNIINTQNREIQQLKYQLQQCRMPRIQYSMSGLAIYPSLPSVSDRSDHTSDDEKYHHLQPPQRSNNHHQTALDLVTTSLALSSVPISEEAEETIVCAQPSMNQQQPVTISTTSTSSGDAQLDGIMNQNQQNGHIPPPQSTQQSQVSISTSESSGDAPLDAIMIINELATPSQSIQQSDVSVSTSESSDKDEIQSEEPTESISVCDNQFREQRSSLSTDSDMVIYNDNASSIDSTQSERPERPKSNPRVQPLPNAFDSQRDTNSSIRIDRTIRTLSKRRVNVEIRVRVNVPSHHIAWLNQVLQSSVITYFYYNACLTDLMRYVFLFNYLITKYLEMLMHENKL